MKKITLLAGTVAAWIINISNAGLITDFSKSFDPSIKYYYPPTNNMGGQSSASDLVVLRKPGYTWHVQTDPDKSVHSTIERQWGSDGDVPVANSDFDGDKKMDIAVWRPAYGMWYILLSSKNWDPGASLIEQWGTTGDYPISNSDFDGDGRDDIAVWRSQNQTWYVLTSSSDFSAQLSIATPSFGGDGNTAEVITGADFDGDGKTDMATYYPQHDGALSVVYSEYDPMFGSYPGVYYEQFLLPLPPDGMFYQRDIPITADYNGDGKADIAFLRPKDYTWHIFLSRGHGFDFPITYQWGRFEDEPVTNSDFDGDGKTDIAVWRPSNGTWYILSSKGGFSTTSAIVRQWGSKNDCDIPIMNSDFDRDGITDIAVFRPMNGYWYILTSTSNFSNTMAVARQWGTKGDRPIYFSSTPVYRACIPRP